MTARAEGSRGGQAGAALLAAALLIICDSAMDVAAQPAAGAEPQGSRVLTLDEALGIADENNRDIRKAKEFRNGVEARYVAERAAALPRLTIVSGISRDRDESLEAFGGGLFPVEKDFRNAEIGLSQVLFAWGQVGAAIRAARVGVALAEDEIALFRQAVARDVSQAFHDVILSKELRAIALQDIEQKARHLDKARRKLDAGTATEYDVLAAEVALQNARPEGIRAENRVRTARERLRFLLGTGGGEVDAEGNLEAEIGPPPSREEALEGALGNRPDVAALRHRIEVARELVTVANAGDKPRLDVEGTYGWRQLDFGGDDEANGQAWSAGARLTFPVFDGLRSRGRAAEARSDLAALEIDLAKLEDALALEVREAVNALEEARAISKALGGTVAQAERLLVMAEKGYEFGVKTRLDVEDAELALVEARGGLARARRDALVARVNLEWVMGTSVTSSRETGTPRTPSPGS